ncbi:hypothetical protein ACFQS6_14320 [Xanthomonas populi]|uniref:hypothetical protein n=1 Tax=Xanthomonas populi TaxID=53414 RepID=UPI000FF89FF7|nr:hypothetical protein [Xanthomonas populi]
MNWLTKSIQTRWLNFAFQMCAPSFGVCDADFISLHQRALLSAGSIMRGGYRISAIRQRAAMTDISCTSAHNSTAGGRSSAGI